MNYFDEQITFSVGSIDVAEPEPPSWAEFLKAEGHSVDTDAGLSEIQEHWELSPSDLSQRMDAYTWATAGECNHGPAARAFHLLQKIDLDSSGVSGRRIGGLDFIEGPRPGSSDCWVEAEDQLTVSLLQARLREVRAPVEVRPGMNA